MPEPRTYYRVDGRVTTPHNGIPKAAAEVSGVSVDITLTQALPTAYVQAEDPSEAIQKWFEDLPSLFKESLGSLAQQEELTIVCRAAGRSELAEEPDSVKPWSSLVDYIEDGD